MNYKEDSKSVERKFQPGDRVSVGCVGKIGDVTDTYASVDVDDRGAVVIVPTCNLTLIEPAYRDPELKPGDRVAAIGATNDTRKWYWVLDAEKGQFVSRMWLDLLPRTKLPTRIRILPPLPGSREEELDERIEKAIARAVFYAGPVARDTIKILRGEA